MMGKHSILEQIPANSQTLWHHWPTDANQTTVTRRPLTDEARRIQIYMIAFLVRSPQYKKKPVARTRNILREKPPAEFLWASPKEQPWRVKVFGRACINGRSFFPLQVYIEIIVQLLRASKYLCVASLVAHGGHLYGHAKLLPALNTRCAQTYLC